MKLQYAALLVIGLGDIALGLPTSSSSLSGRSLLRPRQDGACSNIETCTFTQEEWQALDIDSFLADAIVSIGAGANFPQAFADAFAPFDGRSSPLDECGFLVGASCQHSAFVSQMTSANCPSIASGPEDRCLRYSDARAAIVIENYLQLREGIQAQADAVSNARDRLVQENFVSDLMDGMAQEQGNFVDEILEFVVTLPLQLLTSPFRGVRLAMKAFSQLDSLTFDLIPGGAGAIIEQAQANAEIRDERERIKDQMSRQIDLIVEGERNRLGNILLGVFTSGETVASPEQARNSVPFQLAQSGAYLQGRASQQELDDAAATSIRNIIVTSVMGTMGWQVVRTFDLALEIPGRPGDTTTCRRGQKGLPNILGSPCVVFRRGPSFTDARMQNPDVIERFVDWPAMAQNADQCGGGQLDASFPGDDEDGLPSCFYNFGVNTD